MREPQPHSHRRPSDENKMTRNACTRARKPRTDPQAPKCHSNETWQRHGIWDANMQKLVAKWGAKQPRNKAKWHPMHGISPEIWILASEMAYSYTKHAQYGYAMNRQKQGSPKISILLVQSMAKQQAKIGQQWHAKMALNMRLWSNSQLLTPNRLGAFNNIEEGPKISHITEL